MFTTPVPGPCFCTNGDEYSLVSRCYSVRKWVQKRDYSCPESGKQAWKHWGCENRRSPPVSISEPLSAGFHIPGCMPEVHSAQTDAPLINNCPTPRLWAQDRHILQHSVQKGEQSAQRFPHIGW